MPKRRTHPPEFKARVALDALCSKKTLAELAASYELHPVQVCQWKQQALKRLPDLFRHLDHEDGDYSTESLSQQLAGLERANASLVNEIQWLKKNSTITIRRSCAHSWSQIIHVSLYDVSVS